MGHSVLHRQSFDPYAFEEDTYAGPVGMMQPLPDAPEEDFIETTFYDPLEGETTYRIPNPRPDARPYGPTGVIDPVADTLRNAGKKVSDFFGGIGSATKRIIYSVILFLALGVVAFYFLRAFASRGAAKFG